MKSKYYDLKVAIIIKRAGDMYFLSSILFFSSFLL